MERFPVQIRFSLHWSEMDAMGHVNNARYFTWFESARIALFQRVGLAIAAPLEVGPILAHTSCDFLAPVEYPAEIVTGARIEKVGTKSFTMELAAAHAADPERHVARGRGVVAMVDYRSGETVPVSDELRAALEALG